MGREDSLEKEIATHSSILAWEIPQSEKPGGLESLGSQKCQIQLSNWRTTACVLRRPQKKVAFSSHHIKGTFYQYDLWLLWQSWSPGCSSVFDSPTEKLLSSIHTIWTSSAEKNAIWKTFLNSPQISEWENYIWCRNLQKCFCHKLGWWVGDLWFNYSHDLNGRWCIVWKKVTQLRKALSLPLSSHRHKALFMGCSYSFLRICLIILSWQNLGRERGGTQLRKVCGRR